MTNLKNIFKTILQILFVINLIFFSTLQAKNYNKFNNSDSISNYFSGIIHLNQNEYYDSYQYLKKLKGLENSHKNYSEKYIYSLINTGNFFQAFKYSKKLEEDGLTTFNSDLIMGIYYLKLNKFNLSKKYFLKANNRDLNTVLESYIANSLILWSDLNHTSLTQAMIALERIDQRFANLKKIQNVFLNCYFKSENTKTLFENLTSNKKTDFSRYNYFFANYLNNNGQKVYAKKVIEESLKRYPRNLLINQYKIDFLNGKNNFKFDCGKQEHVIAEILYITANALASQRIYPTSNFYLNLSKYLNQDFRIFDTLLAENFLNTDDFTQAKKIFQEISNYGSVFDWYSKKQISRILIQEKEKEKALKTLRDSFNSLKTKGVYEIYDYAEFLKNNEKFEEAIIFYTKILELIDRKHPLFPKTTDGRGVSYERIGDWKKAEKDLLDSLSESPDQAYVINYLAYTWIEKGVKIDKSLTMLEKANKLKSNDPFIIDSLGWALFKLERFEESKEYLQLALRLMPADPIVNDHYGDVLWKNGKKIQARYYWNYVLNLKEAEENLKRKIKKKLIKGL